MDHAWENLTPDRFQELCQALLVIEFPGVTCFPVAQPDGGRDAIKKQQKSSYEDASIFQIKFKREAVSSKEARKWLSETFDEEVIKAEKLVAQGASSYYMITNVPGTAHLDVGSIDKTAKYFEDRLGCSVSIWWRDDLNRRLEASLSLKLRYPEVLTGHDFLALLIASNSGAAQERRRIAISAFLADQFDEDSELKFKQIELQNKLFELFVDLPFSIKLRQKMEVISNISNSIPFDTRVTGSSAERIGSIDDIAENGGIARLLLSDVCGSVLPQIVIEGAPGQGKSTLSQYICQVHRVRWLGKQEDLVGIPADHARSAIRLPFKIDFRDLATWVSGHDPFDSGPGRVIPTESRSMEAFLCRLVQSRSGGVEFEVADLLSFAKLVPVLIVLDGLDEVADVKGRQEVIAAVSRGLNRMRETCLSVQVVITSRPAVFANSPGFDREAYPHVALGSVRRSQIDSYARKWMDARKLKTRERQEFEGILNEKLEQPHLRDLARNPMQLAILLSLIHTRGSNLPDKRTSLYDAYVDLFFSREAAKNVVVRRNVDLLKDIHRYVAWVLHSQAETSRRRASGRIKEDEFRALIAKYLRNEQHTQDVSDDISDTVLERVVMIVSRVEGTYEFEVQPLREYFAARFLYDTASYSPPGQERSGTKPDRFDAISRNFYWLNVTRFFCGCFSKGELLDLAARVEDLGADPLFGVTRYPASLAAMLLSDWVFTQVPRAAATVVKILDSREGLLRLTSGDQFSKPGLNLAIPMNCGGSILVERAMEIALNVHTKGDVVARLCDFVSDCGGREDAVKLWIRAKPTKSHNLDRWLDVGQALGVFQSTSWDPGSVFPMPFAVDRLSVLKFLNYGRPDLLRFCDASCEEVFNMVLQQQVRPRLQVAVGEPLYLIPTILSVGHYSMYSAPLLHHPIVKDLAESMLRLPAPQSTLPDECIKAYNVSLAFAEKVLHNDNEDVQDSLVGIFELVVENFGEAPAVTLMGALIMRRLRGGSKLRKACLSDEAVPLSKRIQVARSRRKNTGWWRSQFEHAERQSSKNLIARLALLYAPSETILPLADCLADVIEKMDETEWLNLCEMTWMAVEFGSIDDGKINPDQVATSHASNRLNMILCLRNIGNYSSSIFINEFIQERSYPKQIAEYRQVLALHAALASKLEWEIALKIVRDAYAQGAYKRLNQFGFGSFRRETFPASVVSMILNDEKSYPVTLWDISESAAIKSVRGGIRPVSQVASQEGWFRH